MLMRSVFAGVALSALLAASANAATTLSWSAADTGVGQTLNFNGFVGTPASQTVISGLTSQITYTLSTVGNGGKTWTFGYDVANTSGGDTTAARLSSFGFDVSAPVNGVSSTGLFDVASNGSSSIPNGIGVVDVCFRTVANGNCNGGNGGILLGQSASGFITLTFASSQGALDLDNFYVRYQSVAPSTISNSASGIPTGSAVPEPATWAMMIVGFGLTGTLARRARRTAVLAA